jgi:hypothetical protein
MSELTEAEIKEFFTEYQLKQLDEFLTVCNQFEAKFQLTDGFVKRNGGIRGH